MKLNKYIRAWLWYSLSAAVFSILPAVINGIFFGITFWLGMIIIIPVFVIGVIKMAKTLNDD